MNTKFQHKYYTRNIPFIINQCQFYDIFCMVYGYLYSTERQYWKEHVEFVCSTFVQYLHYQLLHCFCFFSGCWTLLVGIVCLLFLPNNESFIKLCVARATAKFYNNDTFQFPQFISQFIVFNSNFVVYQQRFSFLKF